MGGFDQVGTIAGHKCVVVGLLVFAVGCGSKGNPSALDCYAELPEDIDNRPSKTYRATPTRPGPVVAGTQVAEQVQASFVRDPGETEGLFEAIDADWTGIAYDPAHADPTSPGEDWDPDFVFDVVFSDRIPAGFESEVEHFDADSGSMVWATVDRGGVDLELTSLSMVIADAGCDRLVPAANEAFVIELLVPPAQ